MRSPIPWEKNFTDGEIALDLLIGKGCGRIDIYGGGGGREDHLFGNLQLLYAGFLRGVKTAMHTNCTDIYCAAGEIVWRGLAGKTLSLAPVGLSAHIVESEGLKYPLCDLTLRAGSCRGVSNVVESDAARIFCDEGVLFVSKCGRKENGKDHLCQAAVGGARRFAPYRRKGALKEGRVRLASCP